MTFSLRPFGFAFHHIPFIQRALPAPIAWFIWLLMCVLLSPVHPAAAQEDTGSNDLFELENAFPELTFTQLVDLAADGLGFLYVAERAGTVYSFPNDSSTRDARVFLDLTDWVYDDYLEAGLLSIVFHPQYPDNGYVFVYYVADEPLRTVLARFSRSESDPRRADPDSESVILEIEQTTDAHNGGEAVFGPDGFLYLSVGDGGPGGDPYGAGQNRENLLGSIIRIDVDNPTNGKNYAVPPDNPFFGNDQGIREEIYAYGFRNPWRFSIDPESGQMWVGDVGERTWEEVDFVKKGGNYGWSHREGPICWRPPDNCVQDGLYPPVHAYDHDTGKAVIGGFVYRGDLVPELVGKYIFADWVQRQVWALTYDGNDPYEADAKISVDQIAQTDLIPASFGVDESQELYFLTWSKIMRFAATSRIEREKEAELPDAPFHLKLTGPNPFSRTTALELATFKDDFVRVAVYDVLGREIAVLFDGFTRGGSIREIVFPAGSLTNGIYFLRAASAQNVVTRTVVLAR